MPDTRLIERWLPIAEIGEESTRERRSMTALPPTYYLHVWWARRPLVASRAAVLASLLPADADRKRFLHVLGIHGDPVAAKKRIAEATRKGERLGAAAYGYARAFSYTPDSENREWLRGKGMTRATVLDPTAGGGSIPFEAVRCGLSVLANDLNPVAVLIERATVEWPTRHGLALNEAVEELGTRFAAEVRRRLDGLFPAEPQHQSNVRPDGYLWARTVTCPYCEGLVPLSPNWRLAPGGTGVRVLPQCASGPGSEGRVCSFEIVNSAEEQSGGTVARGSGLCPFPDCGRVIDGNAIKKRAQDGRMGDQLYAVVYKKEIPVQTKTGKTRWKWVRCFRATRPEDDNSAHISARLAEKMPEWEALDIVPSERFPANSNDDRPIQYGMPLWRDLFSPRQLLCHGTSVEVFREMLDADRDAGELTAVLRAAYGYLALTLDTALNYNNRAGRWDSTTGRVRSMFDRHDYAFVWSYAEMAPLVTGLGYDWAVEKTTKCIRELVSLVRPPSGAPANGLFAEPTNASSPPPLTITCKPGHDLDHIADASVDVVVMDPPYYDNVMYAELSDFFYVWLKRTAGHVFPELFRRRLTDKENEAVANLARFAGQKGAKARAGRDYQERMAAIFAECRRVLKPDGVMTLMFTHKATGAWDALTTGLIEAGFVITASWPINTEAQGSLHIKDKAAANSTIFLVCRPRTSETAADPAAPMMAAEPVATYEGSPIAVEPSADLFWEDIEPTVAHAVRRRVRGVPGGGDRRGGPLPRVLRPGARRVLPPLAAPPGPAAGRTRTPPRHPQAGSLRRSPRPLRCGPRGRSRRRPAGGKALAPPAVDRDGGRRGSRSDDRLLRPRLGRLQGPGVRLRRGAPPRPCRGGGPRRPDRRPPRREAGQRPPSLGQLPPGCRRSAWATRRLARHGGRAALRGEPGAPAHPRRGDGASPDDPAGRRTAFSAGAQGGARSAPAPRGSHGGGPLGCRCRLWERLRGAEPAPPVRFPRPREGAPATLGLGADGLLTVLRSRRWRRKYTRDDGDLVAGFYVPALESAVRYDRLTGYFGAGALALAARGVEGLVRNDGHMRLVVGCTLDPDEVAAIERGSAWREQVERRLASVPLEPPDQAATDALELLAWMLARGCLDVKVAVPCDDQGRPAAQDGIFHEKSGIIEDSGRQPDRLDRKPQRDSGRLATRNWESIHVFTSWGPEPAARRGRGSQLRSHLGGPVPPPQGDGRSRGGASGPASIPAQGATARPACGMSRWRFRSANSNRRSAPDPCSRPEKPRLVVPRRRSFPCRRRRAGRRGDGSRDTMAPPGARLRSPLPKLAAAPADRRRSGTRQDDPGRDAPPAGVARRAGEADPDPRSPRGAPPVADRAPGEVQPELADLRRPAA